MSRNDEKLIEGLFEMIERLMELLKETHQTEKAKEIYDEFFGE